MKRGPACRATGPARARRGPGLGARARAASAAPAALLALAAAGCTAPLPSGTSFYTERIDPIFEGSCRSRAGGCHVPSDDGSAPGNVAFESYDLLMRRRDLLVTYGPYPVPALLLKAGPPVTVAVEVLDPPDPSRPDDRYELVTTDIRHAGGRTLEGSSDSFLELRAWMERGAMRTGAVRPTTAGDASEPCVHTLGTGPGFDPTVPPADADSYARFVTDVAPVLRDRCAAGGCHGAPLADLHLTCGETETELRWNHYIATQFLGDPPARSELLRRPIPPERGGAFHVGGPIFGSPTDGEYQRIVAWAEETVARDPARFRESDASPGYRFFANRVLPVLVREGCMTLGCHSPVGLRFPLRGGSLGAFSAYARRIDYALARNFLALESPDPLRSRIIEKNLEPSSLVSGGRGLSHRGGALFIDEGSERCGDFDAHAQPLSEVPSLCVLAEWHRIERAEAIARGDIRPEAAPLDGVVWVDRPPGVGLPTEFEVYRPGADLRIAEASLDAEGGVVLGAERSLLSGCGLALGPTDARDPAVSWDGTRIAFAARTSASEPLRLYWVRPDGSECEPIPGVGAPVTEENGILVHDFDPAFAPDGAVIFASTRGNLDRARFDYAGPTRTPARLEANANLYVLDPGEDAPRQLTWLLDQELMPSVMGDGHVIYTAEKRAEDFHVLALRRHLLDGGDYHPLYASRESLGFDSATEVVELPDLRFAFVAAPLDAADGAGSIAIFDRSIGPDEAARDPGDRAYLRSFSEMAPGAWRGMDAAYRSPAPLPTGRILVACALGAGVSAPYDFDLCELEPRDGSLRILRATAGLAELEPVAVYARPRRPIAHSDGREIDHPIIEEGATDAVVRFTDFPMIQSLMFENTRNGRAIDRRIGGFELLEWLPPPVGARAFAELPAESLVTDARGTFFRARRSLGWAPLLPDGSVRVRVPGGVPVSYAPTDAAGAPLEFLDGMPFEGRMVQREAEQYYPGERINRSVPRRFFNALCAGCHGSISGRELDVGVDVDILSGASRDMARTAAALDLFAGHE